MSDEKKTNCWTGVIKYKHPDGKEDSICIKCYGKSMSQAKYKFYEVVRHINASIQLEALTTHGKDFGVSVPQKVLDTKNAIVVARKNDSSISTAKEDEEYDKAFDKAIGDLPYKATEDLPF